MISLTYVHRTLERYVLQASGQFPVVMLTGARQVGKTTLLNHLRNQDRNYVTLDDPLVLALAKDDPALFMQRFPPPVLIDEIQYAPELLPYIKMSVDRQKQPGMYWLTGSQQFHLMRGISESLAGRVGVVNLLGLSRRELLGRSAESVPFLPLPDIITDHVSNEPLGVRELYRLIWKGSFPGIALNTQMERDLFFASYVRTYLQRDIRDLARVGNEMSFLRFLTAVAARTGQMLNIADLARDADVSPKTAKKWLSILQASGIVYLLEPYYTNLTKRLVKAPKVYFLDTGLCAYLTRWSSSDTLETGAMAGPILETWIVAELLKSYWHNGREAPFYYYRDKDKKEIDLLIVQDDTVYPLEFKKTASPNKATVRHFKVLGKLPLKVGTGGVICLVNQALPLTAESWAIPVGVL